MVIMVWWCCGVLALNGRCAAHMPAVLDLHDLHILHHHKHSVDVVATAINTATVILPKVEDLQ
jgi:hypothetical protein